MECHEREGVVFKLVTSDKELQKAQMLRHDVYLRFSYINAPYPDRIIPDLQDLFSEYIVGIEGDDVVGTLRITPNNPLVDLFDEWKEFIIEGKEEKVDSLMATNFIIVGALAVRKDLSCKKVSWGIYKSILLLSAEREISHWLIAIDNLALRTLERLGWLVEKVGEPIVYMGSKTTLGIVEVNKQLASFARKNPEYYAYVIS